MIEECLNEKRWWSVAMSVYETVYQRVKSNSLLAGKYTPFTLSCCFKDFLAGPSPKKQHLHICSAGISIQFVTVFWQGAKGLSAFFQAKKWCSGTDVKAHTTMVCDADCSHSAHWDCNNLWGVPHSTDLYSLKIAFALLTRNWTCAWKSLIFPGGHLQVKKKECFFLINY